MPEATNKPTILPRKSGLMGTTATALKDVTLETGRTISSSARVIRKSFNICENVLDETLLDTIADKSETYQTTLNRMIISGYTREEAIAILDSYN